jgi:Na+-transporting NADH:ubiquinone oxidoreductase subunit B
MRPGLLRDDLAAILALLPPLAWLWSQDHWVASRLLFCAVLIFGWQALFAQVRRQGMGLHGAVAALLVALFAPMGVPFWQLALGVSFGMVLGEAIFGGRGRNFVQPVALTFAFMAFSFADQPWRQGPDLPLIAILPALALLVITGQARLTVLAGLAAGLAGVSALIAPEQMTMLITGTLVLALLFLTADPAVSGATSLGRLAYGVLAGGLTALFAASGPVFGAVVFATLLAQIFAPLLDHIAIVIHSAWMHHRARRLRNG